jgi:LacI family transcriptional regulator
MPAVHYIKPGVTTLRQPIWEVGQKVIDMLVGLLKGETPTDQHVLLRPELIVRGSSQRQTPSPSQHEEKSALLTRTG